jgi:hypothetical protein
MLLACANSPGFLAFNWSAGFWDISSGIGPCFLLAGGLFKFYANAKEDDQFSTNHS